MREATLQEQATLVGALRAALAAPGRPARLFETHISWVLVSGDDAYKIKKAVRFDFLDFSTLAARRHFCNEELRLNRRLAPAMYLGVVALTGSAGAPRIGGRGRALEYAVHMRAFDQQALWSHRIGQHLLGADEIDQLAHKLARFHQAAPAAPPASPWGAPDGLRRVAAETVAEIASLAAPGAPADAVAAMRAWQAREQQRLRPLFEARKAQGHVRECHGDLHSGNILTAAGTVEVFDCIEFSDELRWIDVIHDLAFIYMELQLHGCRALAARLLNGYLQETGDYAGVALLRYYQADCALVRAKIALMSARQQGGGEQPAAATDAHPAGQLLAAAVKSAEPGRPAIIVMHGFAGSGKSTVARRLVELFGAVQLRADAERKRMHGLPADAHARAPYARGLYDRASTDAVYARLRVLARALVQAGMVPIVDACCLERRQRRLFETLAQELGVPLLLVDVRAREATLRARVAGRLGDRGDPSDADQDVLAHQLRAHDSLDGPEQAHALVIDSEAPFEPGPVIAAVRALWD